MSRPEPEHDPVEQLERELGEHLDEALSRRLSRRLAEHGRIQNWAGLVARYEQDPCASNSRLYLAYHPIFLMWSHIPDDVASAAASGYFGRDDWETLITEGEYASPQGLDLLQTSNVVRADGASEVQLQHGPVLWPVDRPMFAYFVEAGGTQVIDGALEVTAATPDEAIVALAKRVRRRYGDDRTRLNLRSDDPVDIVFRESA